MKENAVIQEVHISQISAGDTIICRDGNVRTISKKNIGKDSLLGRTIFGDSYMGNKLMVQRIVFEVPTNNGVVLR